MSKHIYYCNPMNLEYRYQFERETNASGAKPPYRIYREAADPTLIRFRGDYYLFPSMTGGFLVSKDLREWKFHPFLGDNCVYDYAPDARAVGGYLYLCASKMGNQNVFYRTKDPLTEPFEEIPVDYSFWDPDLFEDDDGRLYLYWGSSSSEPIYGVELDPKTMRWIGRKKGLIYSKVAERGYERNGEDHVPDKTQEEVDAQIEQVLAGMKQKAKAEQKDLGMSDDAARAMLQNYFNLNPYLEGAWMTKHEGRYYLQCAVPGTEHNIYADAVFVADHPLGPFTPAKNNPYSYQPAGFVTGAGHGSTLQDEHGNWWHISSELVGINQKFERRLGLWKAGFDKAGELYCCQRFGDWPIRYDATPFVDPELFLLSYHKKVTVSSGEHAQCVTDENIRTYWQAARAAAGEWAQVDLGEEDLVQAVQVNFVDGKARTTELPGMARPWEDFNEERWMDPETRPLCWILEGSQDGETWEVLCDKSRAATSLPHDFIELEEGKPLRYVRLVVVKTPYGLPACVAGLRIFGRGTGTAPEPAADVEANILYGGLDMEVSWQAAHAVGAAVLWGYRPDALYHCRMVYGAQKVRIGALTKGQATFVRVDVFNENGVTHGTTVRAAASL